MSITRPNYQRYDLNLNAAGQEDIYALVTYVRFVSAIDANNNQVLSTQLGIQLGRASGDVIPFFLNGRISAKAGVDLLRISWAAQPGVTATLIISDQDPDSGIEIEAPPAKQLVTSALGLNATPKRVALVAATPTQLDATANRQAITIDNLDAAATLYIGKDNTVTAATGYPIGPGATRTFDKSAGQIWMFCPAAIAVAAMVEA